MGNNMDKLYHSMARGAAMWKHSQACDSAIRKRAGAWMPAAKAEFDKYQSDPLGPGYDELGALRAAKAVNALENVEFQ